MNNIVVATDFSAASAQATMYAARIARETKSSLFIVNTYQIPVSMADMPVMMVSGEELKKGADKSLRQTKDTVAESFPDIEIEIESRLGDVVDEVNDVCLQKNPVAVVIGTKGYSGIEKLLFGNTLLALVRRCPFPVISVPADARLEVPRNIVFATDLQNTEEVPSEKIIGFVKLLNAKLHIVHINTEKDDLEGSEQPLLNSLDAINPVFHSVSNEDVTEGLQQYVMQNSIDLLLTLPHKHSLYERLFFKLHTEGLIQNMPVPVACIQS